MPSGRSDAPKALNRPLKSVLSPRSDARSIGLPPSAIEPAPAGFHACRGIFLPAHRSSAAQVPTLSGEIHAACASRAHSSDNPNREQQSSHPSPPIGGHPLAGVSGQSASEDSCIHRQEPFSHAVHTPPSQPRLATRPPGFAARGQSQACRSPWPHCTPPQPASPSSKPASQLTASFASMCCYPCTLSG